MDDASLSDFAASDEASDDSPAVEPAVSTYTWHSDPVACADCGTETTRRWRDGEQLVCADCKDW